MLAINQFSFNKIIAVLSAASPLEMSEVVEIEEPLRGCCWMCDAPIATDWSCVCFPAQVEVKI